MAAPYHVVAGVQPDLPFDDLQPLRAMIGDASVVALGESDHSTKRYFEAKARFARFLIEEMGVRSITYEAHWDGAMVASRYVATCQGTAYNAMRSLYWQNSFDATMQEFLRYLCEYNKAHQSDPVTFYGFDIQQLGDEYARKRITQYLNQNAATDAAGLVDGVRTCALARKPGKQPPAITEEANTGCVAGLAALDAYLSAHRGELEARSSRTEYELASLAVNTLRAWHMQIYHGSSGRHPEASVARDEGMAATFLRLRDIHFPGKRSVVMAHNQHVWFRGEELPGTDVFGTKYARAMGSVLRERLGQNYYVLGLFGWKVEIADYQRQHVASIPPPPTDPRFIEFRLHETGHPYLLLDAASPFFGNGQKHFMMGGFRHPYEAIPAEHYSGVFFVDTSPPSDTY